MAEALVSISDCINELRQELTYALASGEGEPFRFALDSVDMELSVVVYREASGKGGVRLWVISGGGEGPISSTNVQKVKLSLQPQLLQPQISESVADAVNSIADNGPDDVSSRQTDGLVTVSPDQVSDDLKIRYTVRPEDYS